MNDKFSQRDYQSPQPAEVSKLMERPLPTAVEAEMCTLGCMILAGVENIHIIGEVLEIVDGAADFHLPKHQSIYQAVIDLYNHNQSIDIVQLAQKLKDANQLDDIGGADYLVELAEAVPTAINAQYYAKIVRDKSRLRSLIDVTGRILRSAHESNETVEDLVDQAEKEIFAIRKTDAADRPTELSILVNDTYEMIEAGKDSGRTITGTATGFYRLDDDLSGLQNGEMIIIAARPSMGKTAFAVNIAEHIAVDERQPVAVFSLEMGKHQLAQRLLSSRSGVDSQRMRRNMINDHELIRLKEACAELYEAPMFIDDTPGISVLQLRAKARRLKSEHDIKAIFIDYMQLMRSPGSESRQQEVSEISRSIKAIARELEVPIVALSQLNRKAEDRTDNRPMLSDLRESGSIEQDADVVMLLHRESYFHKTDPDWVPDDQIESGEVAEIIIAKQRNGPTGVVKVQFNGNTIRFSNLSSATNQNAYASGGFASQDADATPF